MIVMLVCWIIGRAVGGIAQTAIREHVDQYKQSHPLPQDELSEMTEQDDEAGQSQTVSTA